MGHHGIIHISQRSRRTKIKVFIPVSDLKNKKIRKKKKEKDTTVFCNNIRSKNSRKALNCSILTSFHNSRVSLKRR